MEHGGLTMENGDITREYGDFTMENGDIRKSDTSDDLKSTWVHGEFCRDHRDAYFDSGLGFFKSHSLGLKYGTPKSQLLSLSLSKWPFVGFLDFQTRSYGYLFYLMVLMRI